MKNINKILRAPCNNASSKYGAAMGRPNQTQGNPERLHLQQIQFVDGDYDSGGAYWGGGGNPLWCAFSPSDTKNDIPIRVFVRAKNRQEAKAEVLKLLKNDNWNFFQ
jgi:hypothetical protein